MRLWGLVLTSFLLMTSSAAALQLKGITLPETLESEGQVLVLNGAGIRSKWFLDLYVASLYLEKRSSNATVVIASEEPKRLRLEIVSGMITSEKMEKATREGFANAAASGYPTDASLIDAFIDVFREEIRKGDRFDLDYRPDTGVVVMKNGVRRATLPGPPFKNALMAIWLGPKPAQESLKQALLGVSR